MGTSLLTFLSGSSRSSTPKIKGTDRMTLLESSRAQLRPVLQYCGQGGPEMSEARVQGRRWQAGGRQTSRQEGIIILRHRTRLFQVSQVERRSRFRSKSLSRTAVMQRQCHRSKFASL